MNVTVVILTWKRVSLLRETLSDLKNQTFKKFKIHISNANLDEAARIEKIASRFKMLDITISHDGNETRAFRRFEVGRRLADEGTDVLLWIDDDIEFPPNYIETCVKQYEPKTYKSGYAWTFENGGSDYYRKRTRHYNNDYRLHYCGTGISMIDASIFYEPRLHDAPETAYGIEDLWLSFIVDTLPGWEMKYMNMPKGVIIHGADAVALYKEFLPSNNAPYTKADFLKDLVAAGWKLNKQRL